MQRLIMEQLLEWKSSSHRKSLLIRGARQVGKSYIVRELGKEFENYVEVNFEKEPHLADFFNSSLDPFKIVEKIALAKSVDIIPGKTLLFFDEIQSAPRVITALRYFYENMPELHVIAAGSLIEFILGQTGMPVGRVTMLYLYPLSFKEFLIASDRKRLVDFVDTHSPSVPLSEPFLTLLTEYFAEYMAVGGMPEAVKTWMAGRDFKQVRAIHNSILDTYRQDFIKYAKKQQIQHVAKVFSAIPRMLGQKFIYSHIDDSLKSREIKPALELLEMAQIIYRIRHSSSNGVPLEAQCKDSLFKTIFLDVGLAQALLGLDDGAWIVDTAANIVNRGEIVEAFVGQEILAYSSPHSPKNLFYWVREKRNAQAELDYVVSKGAEVIPLEVKSGKIGTLKSLKQFLKEKKTEKGVHISPRNFGKSGNIIEIPLFAIWKIWDDAE